MALRMQRGRSVHMGHNCKSVGSHCFLRGFGCYTATNVHGSFPSGLYAVHLHIPERHLMQMRMSWLQLGSIDLRFLRYGQLDRSLDYLSVCLHQAEHSSDLRGGASSRTGGACAWDGAGLGTVVELGRPHEELCDDHACMLRFVSFAAQLRCVQTW